MGQLKRTEDGRTWVAVNDEQAMWELSAYCNAYDAMAELYAGRLVTTPYAMYRIL